MPDVASWLARLGLDMYIEAFIANEIDFDALGHLNTAFRNWGDTIV